MKHLDKFIFLLFIVSMSGCSSIEYPVANHLEVQPGISSLSYTADLRAVHILKKEDGSHWVLSEPSPDAAFSYEDENDFNLSLISIGSKEGGRDDNISGAADLPLPGRSSYVMFAREVLYRTNEMAFNSNATPEQYQEIFEKALQTIQAVAEVEAANVKNDWSVSVTTGSKASLSLAESSTDSVAESNTTTKDENVSKTETSSDTKDQKITEDDTPVSSDDDSDSSIE
jgi:hypothetical protein